MTGRQYGRMAVWQDGRMKGLRDGRMAGRQYGRMASWQDGGHAAGWPWLSIKKFVKRNFGPIPVGW